MDGSESSEVGKMWDESQVRKYDNMSFEPIPRLPHDDPRVDDLISQNVSSTFI